MEQVGLPQLIKQALDEEDWNDGYSEVKAIQAIERKRIKVSACVEKTGAL